MWDLNPFEVFRSALHLANPTMVQSWINSSLRAQIRSVQTNSTVLLWMHRLANWVLVSSCCTLHVPRSRFFWLWNVDQISLLLWCISSRLPQWKWNSWQYRVLYCPWSKSLCDLQDFVLLVEFCRYAISLEALYPSGPLFGILEIEGSGRCNSVCRHFLRLINFGHRVQFLTSN